jgi:hypothetical protein
VVHGRISPHSIEPKSRAGRKREQG